jgi:hypothetical protein
MKKIFAILVMAALVAALTAAPASAAEYFTISDYDVTVNISDSNAYDVTEVVTADFTTPRHGIYRYIPYGGTWLRSAADGGNTDGAPESRTFMSSATSIPSAGATATSSSRSATRINMSMARRSTAFPTASILRRRPAGRRRGLL